MATKEQLAESLAQLRKWLKPGDTVNCVLRHVSRSGMQREIGLVIMLREGDRCIDLHPNYHASVVTGYRTGKRNGLVVGGCGMDMGFAVVYDLSRRMYPDGFGIEGERVQMAQGRDFRRVTKRRPKTREEAARMVADGFKFRGRNGDSSGWDNDGGYALNSKWL